MIQIKFLKEISRCRLRFMEQARILELFRYICSVKLYDDVLAKSMCIRTILRLHIMYSHSNI